MSKRGPASFAERRVLAVAGLGELAGACFFCGEAGVGGFGFGQESGGMLLFAKQRLLAVADLGE